MAFYKKKNTTFKTGKLDIVVTIIVFIVFFYSFFVVSFKPYRNETGEIMIYKDASGINQTLSTFSLQVVIAPIILLYEMLLLILEGKKRGRYLPWGLYYRMFQYSIILKIREGKQLNKEYFEMRRNDKKQKKEKILQRKKKM